MITVLVGIVKSVLVIIILASFLEILLPEGSLKPFVRFTVGLFVLISILNPLLRVAFTHHNFEVGWWDEKTPPVAAIQEEGQKISKSLLQNSKSSMQEKIEQQISAVAVLVPGVEEVRTLADMDEQGKVTSLHLLIKPEQKNEGEGAGKRLKNLSGNNMLSRDEQNNLGKKVSQLVRNFYGLENTVIEVEFEGGK
ncbi:stage III sporulation protein AF [Syntrophomonas palmitatica]|uniref:stage III sporulation protein AF n=1 Tax=Syntrophomonas palmitatica TaxID=402877 RepID=UPI0006D17374|nr:stage III sporulation protein AF [Syntrophomonas palmitatica]